jgi:hypothetical protein
MTAYPMLGVPPIGLPDCLSIPLPKFRQKKLIFNDLWLPDWACLGQETDGVRCETDEGESFSNWPGPRARTCVRGGFFKGVTRNRLGVAFGSHMNSSLVRNSVR